VRPESPAAASTTTTTTAATAAAATAATAAAAAIFPAPGGWKARLGRRRGVGAHPAAAAEQIVIQPCRRRCRRRAGPGVLGGGGVVYGGVGAAGGGAGAGGGGASAGGGGGGGEAGGDGVGVPQAAPRHEVALSVRCGGRRQLAPVLLLLIYIYIYIYMSRRSI
jgi:hypothetical protein